MGTAKLMTPLFYDGNYNVEKKRMRAVLEREVSNGAASYRLWRSDGKPDLEYPRAANDAYILHVEVNDHLVPLQMTDYDYCEVGSLYCLEVRKWKRLNSKFRRSRI